MLNLYILKTCPYCLKVLDYLKKRGLKYDTFDINIPQNLDALLEFGGKNQVPFLFDPENDVKLYESDDIIDYLSKYSEP